MGAVRSLFVLALGVPGLYPVSTSPRLDPLPISVATPEVRLLGGGLPPRDKVLSDLLKVQGVDPGPYFVWGKTEQYPGEHLHVFEDYPVDSQDCRYRIISLRQWIRSIPGSSVIRYLLIDDSGTLRDSATIYWNNRLSWQLGCVRSPEIGTVDLLEIRDEHPEYNWSDFDTPFVDLGILLNRQKRVYMPWTGTSKLGRIGIEGGHFTAERDTE